MEKEMYKALAAVLLEPKTDEYGNQIESPLARALNTWASDNREDIAAELMKKFKVEEFAEKVSERVVHELTKRPSWSINYSSEELNKRVLELVAEKLADEKMKELKK